MVLETDPETCDQLKDWIGHELIEKDPDIASELIDYVLEILRGLPSVSDKKESGFDAEDLVKLQLKGIVRNPETMVEQYPSRMLALENEEKASRPTSSVKIMHIPIRFLKKEQIKAQFRAFGAIEHCKVNMLERQAVIQYKNESCAIRCTKAATVFFQNRFVKAEFFHGILEDFEGATLISTEPQKSFQIPQSPSPPTPLVSSPEGNDFSKRIQQVQGVQQAIFENNQRSNESFKKNFNELFSSKEKLLRAHQSLLQNLRRKTLDLPPDDTGTTVEQLALEFEELQTSMDKLSITPEAMVNIKLRKLNMDHPNELEMKDARAAAGKKKRAKKSTVLRKKMRRKR
ncbi:LAME_0C01706g1_1 [Lachancea meyersii CBS 8951]|uniref:LAME_0C01706g1_1 n=1 Tax=Lachancea meyersii CBS 8951 TaxID=1266667 RepID=A0A1G4IZU7_9SACH|nr:LAME_0C01706g1_1 [Lachancea meyersii CBS 8951]